MAGELVDFDKVRASLAAKGVEKDGDGGDSGGMDTLEPRVAKLEADVGEIKLILGRMEPVLSRMDGELRKVGQDVAEMKGRMATFATATDVAELKGRVSQLPTVIQMISFVLLILGIAGTLRFFATP